MGTRTLAKTLWRMDLDSRTLSGLLDWVKVNLLISGGNDPHIAGQGL
jgi:hypothetical protein